MKKKWNPTLNRVQMMLFVLLCLKESRSVKNKGAYGVDQIQTKKIGASLLAASLLAAIWQVSPQNHQRDHNRSDGATRTRRIQSLSP
jgi:hypothetical protein